MIGFWVKSSWVRELTVVVLLVESLLGGLGNSDEVIEVELVGEVLVKIILEVLQEVHVLLHEVVSSHSWEREASVIKFPCVNGDLWVLSLLLELLVDLHGLFVMLPVEVSGEVVELDVQLLLGNIDGWLATGSQFSLCLEERISNWSRWIKSELLGK